MSEVAWTLRLLSRLQNYDSSLMYLKNCKHKKYGFLRIWFHMIKDVLNARHEQVLVCSALVRSTTGSVVFKNRAYSLTTVCEHWRNKSVSSIHGICDNVLFRLFPTRDGVSFFSFAKMLPHTCSCLWLPVFELEQTHFFAGKL